MPPTFTLFRRARQGFTGAECLLLGAMLFVFWFPDFNRIWALLAVPVILGGRLLLYRRLWTRTPLDWAFIALIALCLLSIAAAPFRQGNVALTWFGADVRVPYAWIVIGRPVCGVLLAASLIEFARRSGRLMPLVFVTGLLALLLGVLGLLAAQYTVKSEQVMFIIQVLPRLTGFPGAQGGFNVNEIAGGMSWFAPLTLACAFACWTMRPRSPFIMLCALIHSAAFVLLWVAIFLGQSRFAVLGVLPMLLVVVWLLARGRVRVFGLAVLVAFGAWQGIISSNIFSTQADQIQQRDEDSVSSRLLIWQSALGIMRDYPLTGAGMNNFRFAAVRAAYPVAGYETNVLPHAHNEWLQLGADFGIPGVAWLVGVQITAGWLAWRTWRQSTGLGRALALGAVCGIAAHLVYGVGDAIPLWDRLAFGGWWVVGLLGASYWITTQKTEGTFVNSV
ncbi:MAG: O-antigen ligase family protein [Pleurocapsa minor GSE-CHR-MK-17-07R]|jgi:O-antigen ligase|nr:O-antigen ligase family protein [Pleurocapsa minor GSE-CHR-MK 17-07R]